MGEISAMMTLEFKSGTVAPGVSFQCVYRPQMWCKPVGLRVSPEVARHFVLLNAKIGHLLQPGNFPMDLHRFVEGGLFNLDVVHPAIDIALTVLNVSHAHVSFRAELEVEGSR